MRTSSAIQDAIISQLKNASTLRFSELQPDEAPRDLFNYHLKSLVAKGLVSRVPQGYTLSLRGHRYVADAHHTSDALNRLFKINVITIVSRVYRGKTQILTQHRMAHPSYGKRGVMGGTIVKGESSTDGARRKLISETGLTAEFRMLGSERRSQYLLNGELFSDIIFPICYASQSTGELIDTEYGKNQWVGIDKAIEFEQDPHDSIASITTVLQAIRDGTIDDVPLFFTETTQIREK